MRNLYFIDCVVGARIYHTRRNIFATVSKAARITGYGFVFRVVPDGSTFCVECNADYPMSSLWMLVGPATGDGNPTPNGGPNPA